MEHKVIKAQEGKVFRRKIDGVIFDDEITLGYTYYINGEKLAEPKIEVEEDFEQVDKPKKENEEDIGNQVV